MHVVCERIMGEEPRQVRRIWLGGVAAASNNQMLIACGVKIRVKCGSGTGS